MGKKMPMIALVDDDRHILTSVSIALESEGYTTTSYTDGVAALQGLQDNPPDMAIFDIKMPRMDGMELLRRLRQKTDLPVIFLTSKDDEIDELFGLKMGADDFIRKPFSQRLLVERGEWPGDGRHIGRERRLLRRGEGRGGRHENQQGRQAAPELKDNDKGHQRQGQFADFLNGEQHIREPLGRVETQPAPAEPPRSSHSVAALRRSLGGDFGQPRVSGDHPQGMNCRVQPSSPLSSPPGVI